jgi:hypothetical protein
MQHAYRTGAATRRSRRTLGAIQLRHAVLVGPTSLVLISVCRRLPYAHAQDRTVEAQP